MINVDVNVKNWLIKVHVIKIVSVEKRLVDKFAEKCSENIDQAKLSEITLFEHLNECVWSYTVCIVLGVIALTLCIGIGAYFTYRYINRKKENVSKYDYVYHAKNY